MIFRWLILNMLFISGCVSTIPYSFYNEHKTDPYCKVIYAREINARKYWVKEKFPLKVIIQKEFYELYSEEWDFAVKQWEEVLGFSIVNRDYEFYDTYNFDDASTPSEDYDVVVMLNNYSINQSLKRFTHSTGMTAFQSKERVAPYNIGYSQIVINKDTSFSKSKDMEKFHVQSVIVHEVGHLLGLGHNHRFSSVMYPDLDRGEVKDQLSEEDKRNIRCVYLNKQFKKEPSKKDLLFK